MNYTWQTPSDLPASGATALQQAFHDSWRLEYSATAFPDLNEFHLDETAGIGGHQGDKVLLLSSRTIVDENGPVDWNHDGDKTDHDVGVILADRNGDDAITIQDNPADGETLKGYEDWSHLFYYFRDRDGFADGVHNESTLNTEITFDVFQQLSRIGGESVNVAPTSGLVTTESGGSATFTMVLNAPPAADVTIGLSSSNTGEGTVFPASLTFTTTNWSVPQTVMVTGVDDQVDDGNVAYQIVTAAAISGDPNYNGLSVDDISVTNTNDDTAGTVQFDQAAFSIAKDGGSITIKVDRTGGAASGVTVDYCHQRRHGTRGDRLHRHGRDAHLRRR